ncbi:potassium transporter KefB [Mucilaginibacter terrigena]|uniref:Potassium transporter KefB n=1 Tax=Mucilaginibacter terrigena TaxID=2492395 RepID=A0A4Q5LMD2_9SPHI|nr:potassium transporter KefB [Mucilaginibacter terrigena]RYU90838.1 potassium transporter KefB [Mucilaginibacter terrigena]
MTTTNNTTKPIFTGALGKRMLTGAIIGLAIISFFVIGAGKGNPAWGDYWRVKPLLLTPFLGAMVGLCYDISEPLGRLNGWMGKVFLLLSFVGYFIGMWMSMVLGLAGTMWH